MEYGFLYPRDSIPFYDCPTCGRGKMHPDIDNSLSRQTGESIYLGKLDYWEESFHKELLRIDTACSDSTCKEVGVLVMLGELFARDDYQSEPEVLYRPIFINPAPHFFKLDDVYPVEIRSLAKEAFSLFWSDLASCGNKIRVGVEALLNDQGIDSEQLDKNGIRVLSKKGRPKPINLQNRLELFKKKGGVQSDCVAALESIKWLGNESSHAGDQIHQDIVYSALMVLGDVLGLLYKRVPLPKDFNYRLEHINFWYHPDTQATWPE